MYKFLVTYCLIIVNVNGIYVNNEEKIYGKVYAFHPMVKKYSSIINIHSNFSLDLDNLVLNDFYTELIIKQSNLTHLNCKVFHKELICLPNIIIINDCNNYYKYDLFIKSEFDWLNQNLINISNSKIIINIKKPISVVYTLFLLIFYFAFMETNNFYQTLN